MVAFIVGNSHPAIPVSAIPTSGELSANPAASPAGSAAAATCGCASRSCKPTNLDRTDGEQVSDPSRQINCCGTDGQDAGKRTELIPGLPDDVAVKCLARVSIVCHHSCRAVSRTWRALFSSLLLFAARRIEGRQEQLLALFHGDPSVSGGWLLHQSQRDTCPSSNHSQRGDTCPSPSSNQSRSPTWRRRRIPPMTPTLNTYGLSGYGLAAADTCLFLIGGTVFDATAYPSDRPVPTSRVFSFDLVSNQWRQCASMADPRASFASASLPSPLLVSSNISSSSGGGGGGGSGGGSGGGGSSRNSTGLSIKRVGRSVVAGEMECTVNKGAVLVAGGSHSPAPAMAGSVQLAAAEWYDVASDTWHPLPPLPEARGGCVGALVSSPAGSCESMGSRCDSSRSRCDSTRARCDRSSRGRCDNSEGSCRGECGSGSENNAMLVVVGGFGSEPDWQVPAGVVGAAAPVRPVRAFLPSAGAWVSTPLDASTPSDVSNPSNVAMPNPNPAAARGEQVSSLSSAREGGLSLAAAAAEAMSGVCLPVERRSAGPVAVLHGRLYMLAALFDPRHSFLLRLRPCQAPSPPAARLLPHD
ncbi:unnamed protein product [Closterium sp. Yama58-4]|nr:unnamed protein product [Closterium sp. Yama58-4]